MSLENGNALHANDRDVPEMTPESLMIMRLTDTAKLFDAELIELIKKHKPTNFVSVVSFSDCLSLPGEPMPLMRRVNAMKLIGDPAANSGLVGQLLNSVRNALGIR